MNIFHNQNDNIKYGCSTVTYSFQNVEYICYLNPDQAKSIKWSVSFCSGFCLIRPTWFPDQGQPWSALNTQNFTRIKKIWSYILDQGIPWPWWHTEAALSQTSCFNTQKAFQKTSAVQGTRDIIFWTQTPYYGPPCTPCFFLILSYARIMPSAFIILTFPVFSWAAVSWVKITVCLPARLPGNAK